MKKTSWWPPVAPCPARGLGRWRGRKTRGRAARSSSRSSRAGGARRRHHVSVPISTLYWNSQRWEWAYHKEHAGRVRPGARQGDSWRWRLSCLPERIWPELRAPPSITPCKAPPPLLRPPAPCPPAPPPPPPCAPDVPGGKGGCGWPQQRGCSRSPATSAPPGVTLFSSSLLASPC